jgi:hypothetical protein
MANYKALKSVIWIRLASKFSHLCSLPLHSALFRPTIWEGANQAATSQRHALVALI